MRKRKHRSTGGYSLIEVVTSIALLGLVSASVCASLVLAVRLNVRSEQLMQAQLAVSSAVETLMAQGVSETSDYSEVFRDVEVSPLVDADGRWVKADGCYEVTVTSSLLDSVTVTTWIHAADDAVEGTG